jgi:hypothetical protein
VSALLCRCRGLARGREEERERKLVLTQDSVEKCLGKKSPRKERQ